MILNNAVYSDVLDSCTQCDFEEPPSDIDELSTEDVSMEQQSKMVEQLVN